MSVTVHQLPSGYWHVRGRGPCNWAQVISWPCRSIEELRRGAFLEASEEFIRAAWELSEGSRP